MVLFPPAKLSEVEHYHSISKNHVAQLTTDANASFMLYDRVEIVLLVTGDTGAAAVDFVVSSSVLGMGLLFVTS